MDQRILEGYLRGEVARLRRLVPGGASGNTPFSSPAGGRDRSDETAMLRTQNHSVISQPERPFILSPQVRERLPCAELGFFGLFSSEVHFFVPGGARTRVRQDWRFCSSRTSR